MTAYLVGAAVALAAAGFCFRRAKEASARRARLLLTETSSTALLGELQAAATAAAGPGSFAEPVELEGVAVAGPRGLLTSEISKTACVWHRHEITRKYRDVDHDSEGRRQTATNEEVVTENSTQEPLGLRDADGEITIVPSVDVDHVRKSVSEFRESHERHESTTSVGSFSFGIPSGDHRLYTWRGAGTVVVAVVLVVLGFTVGS